MLPVSISANGREGATLRLISYEHQGASGVGVMLDDERFVALSKAAPDLPRTLRGILALGEDGLTKAKAAAEGREADHELDDVTLLPPIPDPPAIWCVGLNYAAHREETGRTPTSEPTLFMRIPASQVAHGEAMIRPKASHQLDYEGELAVIIGKTGRHIAQTEAMSHVAGYSCYNDGSVRDWQRHTSQFAPGKNFHRTGGFGPWLLTADELPNPYEQSLITRVSGEELQRTTIDLMLFKIEKLIEYLSTLYPLNPGDVISTGTPAGVGSKRDPKRWLVPGDIVEVEITGVGTLVNPVVDET